MIRGHSNCTNTMAIRLQIVGLFFISVLALFATVHVAHAQAVNLIPNGNFETANGTAPSGWATSYWGSPVPTFKYPAVGMNGSKGVSITLGANSTGDANWQRSSAIAVTPNTAYTYTTWYNSTVATEIDARYTTASGAVSYAGIASVPSSGGVWKQFSVTLVIPSGKTKAVFYHLISNKGTLTIDDVSLTSPTAAQPAPTVNFAASPTAITSGQSSTLSWSSTNATSCVASGGWSGTKAVSGTEVVSPTATTIFTLSCTGSGGTSAKQVTVTVTPVPAPTAPTLTFTATPASIVAGQSSTLSWSSANATSCVATTGSGGAKPLSGSQVVTPTVTTSYGLSCSGTGGTTTKSVTVTVSAPPTDPNKFSEGMVTLSFDDSWISQYTTVLPMLQAATIKGTFYLTTQPIQEGWSDFMTPSQIQTIATQGHEIAGHTITHPHLPQLTSAQMTAEIVNSKTYLQNLTGKSITTFAYPYGEFNAAVKSLVLQAGYTSARGIEQDALNTRQSDKYNLKSSCIELSATFASIKAQIDAAKANKQWYILCIHEVKTGGDQYSITPTTMQQIIDYIKSTGIKSVTVAEGRALMAN